MASVEGRLPCWSGSPRCSSASPTSQTCWQGSKKGRRGAFGDAYDRLWPTVKRLEAEVKAKVEEAMGRHSWR